MSHFYSLDGKHLFKGLSILCKIPLHITVILQEMDVEPALHLMPVPEGHFGLLAQPVGPVCLQAHWVAYSMQPSGNTFLLSHSTHKPLHLRESRGLCTSKHTDWGNIGKSREFYKTCTFSSCASFVLLLSWIIELLKNTMQTAPEAHTLFISRQVQLSHCTLLLEATSALAWTMCWLSFWASAALFSVMGLLPRWAVRFQHFMRLSGSGVTQDVQGRVKIHY